MLYLRSFNRFILTCLALLVMGVSTANAALVSQLSGVNVDGTLYDVTFHTDPFDSFNALWDGNDDGLFGVDGSLFDTAPTFWGNQIGAMAAVTAVMSALGTEDTLSSRFPWDAFQVPYQYHNPPTHDRVLVWIDSYNDPLVDEGSQSLARDNSPVEPHVKAGAPPYATFTPTAVPVPAAVWLFGSALIGLVGVSKRKYRIAA
jgi:hypothetical protein